MQHTYAFSLIVPTLGRSKELGTLLKSLCNQTFSSFEVIIVDQNTDDTALRVIAPFTTQLSITHVRQQDRGASRARNAGLRKAQGEIISFPDDDCEYSPDLLQKVYELFSEHGEWDGIAGLCRDPFARKNHALMYKNQQKIHRYNLFWTVLEAALFLRATAIKGFFFDESMGVGASTPWWSDEGPDLVMRIIRDTNAYIVYKPQLEIYHKHPIQNYDEKDAIRSYRYGCGRGWCMRKHGYPLWFAVYMWSFHVAGIFIGCARFNMGMIRYYFRGLVGRIEGYVSSS